MTSAVDPIPWADARRHEAFEAWLAPLCTRHGLDRATLAPASADASFRRYLRVSGAAGSMVVMDAPPPMEDVRPFVDVARRLRDAGLNAPTVHAADETNGFLLLADLGSRLYLDAFGEASASEADGLMRDATRALVQWQHLGDARGLPPYDEALLQAEMALFPDWCVSREYGVAWGEPQQRTWQRVTAALVRSALDQPKVAVHRDWMPRNLMVCDVNPGVLDFQDAVLGPVTYDIASLLRDAFWSWDEEREIDWAARWWEQARRSGILEGHAMAEDFGECWRAIEWMGLQRHLKILGIFSRLKHRDGKPRYAADLPRFFGYAAKVAARYRELKPLVSLLEPLAGPLLTTGFTLR